MRKILNGQKKMAYSNIEYTSLSGRTLDSLLAHD